MFKQDKTINLSKNCLLLLPHTHGTRVRDVVGLREGRRKPWKLTRCWFLVESWRRSGVESPPLFTSDAKECTRLLLYRDGAGERVAEKAGREKDEFAQIWALHAFFGKSKLLFHFFSSFSSFFCKSCLFSLLFSKVDPLFP